MVLSKVTVIMKTFVFYPLAKETNKLTISIYLTQYGIKPIQYP